MSSIPTIQTRPTEVSRTNSTQHRLGLSTQLVGDLITDESWFPTVRPAVEFQDAVEKLLHGIRRRWLRERRRRKVGRAYDMAQEIARVIPPGSRVLDVGCGNGYISHHLSAMLNAGVVGIDLGDTTEAPIDYRPFNGTHFPVADQSFNAILLCYVLHHAQNLDVVMGELGRVLSDGGLAVVYEDIPGAWWDRFVCWTHDLKWRKRTGPCTFRSASDWSVQFNLAGFEIVNERELARWRNLAHPVRRRFYLLKLRGNTQHLSAIHITEPRA